MYDPCVQLMVRIRIIAVKQELKRESREQNMSFSEPHNHVPHWVFFGVLLSLYPTNKSPSSLGHKAFVTMPGIEPVTSKR